MKKTEDLPQLKTLDELEEYLFVALPNAHKVLFSAGKGFGRSKKFYEFLGNPQNEPKTIHIAGTSGKGSTAYYLSALLISHGFKVGTHVSPQVFDLRESAMIDLNFPSESDFVKNFRFIIPEILKMQATDHGLPTYFEAVLGNAFTLFANQKVDYSVIETGLGGKYDSTNTINRTDKLSVITKIGLDHTEVLGDTLAEIAEQKAGIINQNSEVIAVDNNIYVTKVFKANAQQKNASLNLINPINFGKNIHKLDLRKTPTPSEPPRIAKNFFSSVNVSTDMLPYEKKVFSSSGDVFERRSSLRKSSIKNGNIIFDYDDGELKITNCKLNTFADYQVENACLAIYVFKKLSKRDNFEINPSLVKKALLEVVIPGRCELREYRGKKLIIDGAHNPQKMEGFVDSIKALELPNKPTWVLAVKKDKDARGMLEKIMPHIGTVICTEFFSNSPNERLKDYAMSAKDLGLVIRTINPSQDVKIIEYPDKALQFAINTSSKDELVVVSGSLYLLSEISEALNKA